MPFYLTESATSIVTTLIRESGCANPVVSLGEVSDLAPGSNAIRDALHREAKDEELIEIAHSKIDLASLDFRLAVLVNERRECSQEDLSMVGAIVFAMSDPLRKVLQSYHLDYAQGEFSLVGPKGIMLNLRSLERKAENHGE